MSIPQICPSCGNHISAAHATDCCYGTSEYAHVGWPSNQGPSLPGADGVELINIAHPILRRAHSADSAGILTMGDGIAHTSLMSSDELESFITEELAGHTHPVSNIATAIRRLYEYLGEEPDEGPLVQPEPMEEKVADISDKTKILCRLNDKCNELRKEAAGIYNVEARAKRNFAADILESLIEEETSAW